MAPRSSMELGLKHPMYRSMMHELVRWKGDPVRKALLLRGERQVGKTTLVRKFAADHYDSYAEFNFYESAKDRELFENSRSLDDLMVAISLSREGFSMTKDNGLLFLDEIQECPEALTAVKFIVQKCDVDVILSGSMLGCGFKIPRSFPVGSITFRDMHPMTFEEFLLSQGVDKTIPDMIRMHVRERRPFGEATFDVLQSLFREYMIVGGMPECVLRYTLDKGDMDAVITAQKDIVSSYRSDIVSYAPARMKQSVSKEFELIPSQLSRRNKKVVFSEIDQQTNVGLREYGGTIGWMIESRFVNPCYNISALEHPLEEHIVCKSVKMYSNDTGLLLSMMGRDTMMAILDGDTSVNEGAITENIVMQMMIACGQKVYYFETNRDGAPRLEVDFITMLGSELAAIEVKSGKYRRSSSIRKLKETPYGTNVRRYIKFYNGNIIGDDPEFEHYPLFCAGFMDAMHNPSKPVMPERPSGFVDMLSGRV